MVSWTATVGGTSVSNIFEVNYERGESDRLGKAEIIAANDSTNRGFSSGEEVILKKNGTTDFKGFVVGKPSKDGAERTEIRIEALDKRVELKYEQINRVFYNMDTGNIIKEAVNNRIAPVSIENVQYGEFIHKGDSKSNWTTDIPEFSKAEISNQRLYEAGSDFLFLGWPEGSGDSTYKITFKNVPSSAIPGDGQIDKFFTRMLVNNRGSQFSAEVNLRDNSGNNYNWPINIVGNDFEVYELPAEEANTTASIGSALSTNGYLEYRFEIEGTLPESRAVGIDFASTIPFTTSSRSSSVTPTGVQQTGNTVTRRIDRSIFQLLKEFGQEDGFISYIDTNDVLHYEQSGQQASSKSIDFNSTAVTEATFHRDYENITNKVTVQGAGDVRVTLEDTASIQFYGVSPREEPIIDEQIQTEDDAVRRGRGYLRENAWDDTAFEFEVADASYQSVQIGDDITVNWTPENISGVYTVSEVKTDNNGIVTIGLTATDTT